MGRRATLAGLAQARIKQIGNATHYRAEIPETPPTVSATDMRVLAYTVLWPGGGGPGEEEALGGGRQDDVDWTFLVTCAAGLAELVDPLVDLVLEQLDGWEPVIDGASVGTCALDFDPGPVVPDPGRTPTRYFIQLPFRLRVGS